MDRRNFMLSSGSVLGSTLLSGLSATMAKAAAATRGRSAVAIAQDEGYWLPIQQAYNVDSRYILLNAGGSNPCPRGVHETRQRLHEFVNASPNINSVRSDIPATVGSVRRRLASHLGVDDDEVALTRNTTEGISTFIASLDLKPGDEILCSDQEYHVTEAAMRLRERRDGARIVRVSWPTPAASHEQIVTAYRGGFSPRTKAVMLCQILHVGGQIMPVRQICEEARRREVLSGVDGALGFGHVVTNVRDLGCDYYATSLHKYLSAPLGTGLFYVRKPLIESTWPLFGIEPGVADDQIMKFEYVGTRPMADFASVATALDFYEAVGPERKQARLHYLKRYWMDQVAGEPRLRFSAKPDPSDSCASIIVSIDGVSGRDLNRELAEKHRIWCYGPVKAGPFEGVYVAPNLFTRPAQLDQFVTALRNIARSGVTAPATTPTH